MVASRKDLFNRLVMLSLSVSLLMLPQSIPAKGASLSQNSSGESDIADETLLLLLAPHTDREKAKATIWNELNATTLDEIHVDHDDYSILQLSPQPGQREATLSKIQAMQKKKQHPEYISVTRNYRATGNQQAGGGVVASASTNSSMPDDPLFSQQWPLSNMNWPAAWNAFHGVQKRSAKITIVGTNGTSVPQNFELGTYIVEYNTLAKTPYREQIVPPGSTEGNIDSSLTGCLSDNDVFLAGDASFTPSYPCYITIARVCDPPDNESTTLANIYRGVAWAINNQKIRGGPGPVNLSYNHHSAPCTSAAFQLDPTLQTLAASLVKQGDILVESAGDTPCTNNLHPSGTGSIVLVQGTNKANTFDTAELTTVTNDPVGAPGAVQPYLYQGRLANNYGSSYSAPHWTSAIAMVMAFNPSLNASQAHRIVLKTGIPVVNAPWPAVIPDFYHAIYTALHQ